MISLKIDGVECPLSDNSVTLPSYNSKILKSVERWRDNKQVELYVVATPEMEELLAHPDDLYRWEDFNMGRHRAELEADGTVLFEGTALLLGVKELKAQRHYHIAIRSAGAEWALEAAQKQLHELPLTAERKMTLEDIEESWSDNSIIRMIPLRHDSYPEPVDTGLYTPEQPLTTSDYHPFIAVAPLIRSIAHESGYELCSSFLTSAKAEKLMMSGAYKQVDASVAAANMGFKAMRTYSSTAKAGSDGRVYVWEPKIASNIGAIVDTVSPNAVEESGEPMLGAYSTGGCFTFEKGRPVFRPRRDISVAFDIHLRYATEYRITSSKLLTGFNRIHLCNGCDVGVELKNPYKDLRNEVNSNTSYKLFIFDYDPTLTYELAGYGEVTSQVSDITFEPDYSGRTALYVKRGTILTQYLGDWAIYEGHVTEVGTRDIELTLRTPFLDLTPTKPMLFNDMFFYGATTGQQLTLKARCSIVPIFSGAVGYGESFNFEDVARHNISPADLLEAIAHMFNLRIYSHAPSRRLYIEPYDDFYGSNIVEWGERQIAKSSRLEELATESFRSLKLGYQAADGVVTRIEGDSAKEFGTWLHTNENYAAKQSLKHSRNPLFSPIASESKAVASAPSVEVLTVGDRDAIAEDDYIAPRIVLYHGIQPLKQGETWPTANSTANYPCAAFHSSIMGETLCFEDRDGLTGLHAYYDQELAEQEHQQRLICDISIEPHEYVDLFDPATDGATIRSLFRLNYNGASSLFILEQIESYDPENCIARCRFRRTMKD